MNRTVLKAIQGFKDKRLGQKDVADLEFYWNEYESEIGVKAIDYSSVHVDGGEYVQDPLTETIYATERARRIRAKLASISAAHARILFRVYGYQNRFAPFGRLGDLAGIIEYTPLGSGFTRDELEIHLQEADFERRIRMEAERLLWDASAAYRSA